MSNLETLGVAPLSELPASPLSLQAQAAAAMVAQELSLEEPLHTLRVKASSSWVFTDRPPADSTPGSTDPTVVIRLTTAEDPAQLLADTQRDVSILRQLRTADTARQAPVQNFITEPLLVNGFVATVSEYLPRPLGSLVAYGGALALLHNVSEQLPEVSRQARPFTPLAKMRRTYEYLSQHPEVLASTPGFLETVFLPRLEEGEAATEEMLRLSEARGYPLVTTQHDVTLANALRDKNGVTTLIDMENLMCGPAEFALGRPLGQWYRHFSRPKSWASDVRFGYEQLARRPLDSDILAQSLLVSRLKYAASPLNQMVTSLTHNEIPDAWQTNEGIRRLSTFQDMQAALWISQEAYLKGTVPPELLVSSSRLVVNGQ